MLKTDVKSNYASIDHVLLHEQLSKHIQDKGVLRLLWQYMRRCAERGGVFYDIERGISLYARLGQYVQRWGKWARAGPGCEVGVSLLARSDNYLTEPSVEGGISHGCWFSATLGYLIPMTRSVAAAAPS